MAEHVAGGERAARALVAEINLLLDFVSGRSDRLLGGGQVLRLPSDCTDFTEALARFFEIQAHLEGKTQDRPADIPPASAEGAPP